MITIWSLSIYELYYQNMASVQPSTSGNYFKEQNRPNEIILNIEEDEMMNRSEWRVIRDSYQHTFSVANAMLRQCESEEGYCDNKWGSKPLFTFLISMIMDNIHFLLSSRFQLPTKGSFFFSPLS